MDISFRLYFSDETVCVPINALIGKAEGNKTHYITEVHGARIDWCFEKLDSGVLITLSAESDQPLNLLRADSIVFSVNSHKATDRILFFGNQLCSCTHRYPCELADNTEYSADCTGLYEDLAAEGIALAAVAPFTNVVGAGVRKANGQLEYFAKTEYTVGMQSEHRLTAERFFFANSITIDSLYDRYRAMLPQSRFSMPKLTGWNTWDYYLDRVTPEDIFENVEALSRMPFADRLEYVVIDDGWQKEWGEWVENEKFSCGLSKVADRIKEHGFLPGIWASPLLMKECCESFDKRKHWFCRDEKGEFIRSEGRTCVIDPTVPDAREFILEIYRRLYRYGYRLFKIDYVSPLLKVKSFQDKSATPYSVLRELIRDVKGCTGEDAVILGCSLPVQCGADIAPSMRIGVDIHNHFGHVKWIAEMLSWTWMYNNKVTRIDPDFLIVRGLDTADEPLKWEGSPNYTAPKRMCDMNDTDLFRSRWRQGDQFNAVEAETWANLVAISGGNLFLSDRMSVLNRRGISIIDSAMNATQEECRPVYLHTDTRLPSLWLAESRLLLVNWEDVPATITAENLSMTLTSDKTFIHKDNKLTVTLLPHESFLAVLN
ncbi:MAG: alpha-galactosidase [Clostridia bacterium]|nr:alpha-galactosidase [Clostridia bacterium]